MARKDWKISDSEALRMIEARVDVHGTSTHRQPFEHQVWKNRAFFFGKQHLVQDPWSGRLRNPTNIPVHRIFYRANLMLGNIMRSVQTTGGANGQFAVPPKDGTRRSRHGAWVSTKLFEHFSYAEEMEEKEELALLFAALDGSCIWKVYWDPDRGEPERFWFGDPDGRTVMVDPDEATMQRLEEAGQYRDMAPGDVVADPFPWSQAWWDWAARDGGFDDAAWAAQGQIVSMSTIENLYGMEEAAKVKPDQALSGSLYYDEAISFMSSGLGHAEAYDDPYARDEERTILVEYWSRPSARNGWYGRNIHVAGGHVLRNRDNVFRRTGYPIPLIRQDWIRAPGRFLGVSLAEQLTSPQHHYNTARATIAEHRKIYGHPAILVPEKSNIPTGHLTLEPGTVQSYDPQGGEIKFGQHPKLPPEVLQDVELARNEMADISSQATLDASKLPGQLRSAPALDAAFAERNKLLAHPAKNFLKAKHRIGRQALALMHKFYEPNRVVSYVGEDRKWRVLSFVQADVNTDLRLRVDKGQMLKAPSLTKAEIVEWIQIGAINPADPDEKEAIFKALEFGGADELIGDRLQEEENQEREIAAMVEDPLKYVEPHRDELAMAMRDPQTGKMVPPPLVQGYPVRELFDDHRIHYRVLVRYMRSEEFRDLDPLAQSLIYEHAMAHKKVLDQQAMIAMMMQQMSQGSPGQKGQPSQPKSTGPAPAMAG